jgi:acyl-CoA reductase-like NAD-dependent aldehyde dehydrogenase
MPFKSVNPATGELVRTFEEISDRDLELALATAHKAYETDWRLRPGPSSPPTSSGGHKLATEIESGMVFIYQPIRTTPELPFGGVKNSGFGRGLSELGFDEFVNKKLINLAPVGSPALGSATAR